MLFPIANSVHYPKFRFSNISVLEFQAGIQRDMHRLTDGLSKANRYNVLRYVFATHYEILDKLLTAGLVSHERLAFIAMNRFMGEYVIGASGSGGALDNYEALCFDLLQLTKLIEAEGLGRTSYNGVFIDEDLLEDE